MSVKSIKSLKSSRSVKSGTEYASGLGDKIDFGEAVITICQKLANTIDVIVNKTYMQELKLNKTAKSSKRIGRPKSRAHMISSFGSHTTVAAPTKTDPASAEMISDDVLIITAVNTTDNYLVEIILNRYKHCILPRAVLEALTIVAPKFKNLAKITIKDCIINTYTIYEISNIISAAKITDLCLDQTSFAEGNFDVILGNATTLEHLSLRGCKINDVVCESIVRYLHCSKQSETSLLTLNLTSNHITDIGVRSIAEALRSNRHLRYLNLADNQITDEGAIVLFDSLKEFPLTPEEIRSAREQSMKYLWNKRAIYVKCLQDLENLNVDNIVKKVVKLKKSTASIKSKNERKRDMASSVVAEDIINAKAEFMALELAGVFEHPYTKSQVTIIDERVYCKGNLTLCYLNLAYNNLMYPSLKRLLEVVVYQKTRRNEYLSGLMAVVLDGNNLPVKCSELDTISDIFQQYVTNKKT